MQQFSLNGIFSPQVLLEKAQPTGWSPYWAVLIPCPGEEAESQWSPHFPWSRAWRTQGNRLFESQGCSCRRHNPCANRDISPHHPRGEQSLPWEQILPIPACSPLFPALTSSPCPAKNKPKINSSHECFGDKSMLHVPNCRNPDPTNASVEKKFHARRRNSTQKTHPKVEPFPSGMTFPAGTAENGCHPLHVTFRADKMWVPPHLCDLLRQPRGWIIHFGGCQQGEWDTSKVDSSQLSE